MIYQLEALDTLTFRTANPFDAGVNFHAYSQFPPLPSVYAGALRKGEAIEARKIKIGFSGVLLNNEFAFPQPLDTLITNEKTDNQEGENELTAMALFKKRHSNHELEWMLAPTEEIEKKVSVSGGAYIKEAALQQYLNGDRKITYEKLGDYFKRESHIGIEMEQKTHATKQGMWYSTELIRPHQCSLVVEATGIKTKEGDAIKIGGNTKLAHVKLIESFTITPPVANNGYFKLYFATPAMFKYGWLPRWIDPKTKEGTFTMKKRKVKVKLIAAAIDKPVPVGGYTENGGPRPMRMAIPAGSVYYFKLLDGTTYEDAVKLFHQKCLSDYRIPFDFNYGWWDRLVYCDRGFGYALVGKMKEDMFHEE